MKNLGGKLFLEKKSSPKPPFKKTLMGGAYIMVIVATLAVLTLVLTVLTVTAASRNITARYQYFFGLYDLAAAGNEQAFLFMQSNIENLDEAIAAKFPRNWNLLADFGDFQDDFRAATTVNNLIIRTYIRKYNEGIPGTQAIVQSRVKFLDDYTLTMVELLRIAD